MAVVNSCEKKPLNIDNGTEVDSLKNLINEQKKQVDTVKVEVIKWEEAKKSLPKYRTKFDSTATIDTVKAELAKCDTITIVDSIIINKQDSIIQKQDTIIQDQSKFIDSLGVGLKKANKEIRRQKRKVLFTKIGAGAVIVLIGLLLI